MIWVPLLAWAAALVLALVVLGFCAYEIFWKAHRLRGDLDRLRALEGPARELQVGLAAAQVRLARAVETR